MGWSFGWYSKRDIVQYLNDQQGSKHYGENYKIITNCVRGNCHWQVVEHRGGKRFIALNLLQSYDKEWGYKDMDESMGPCEVNCPLSYLELAPETEDTGQYAKEWRKRVREYHANRKPSQKLAVGQVWKLQRTRDPITVKLTKVKPLRGYDVNSGRLYRIPRKCLGELQGAA